MDYKILQEFPSPDLELQWRDYLTRVEFPSHYDAPEFFLEPLWPGKQRFAVLAVENGRIAGTLTGMHSGKHAMCGVSSRPQINVEKDGNIEQILDALARGLLEESRSAELVSVYTWPWLKLPAFSELGFRSHELPGGNVVLDLTMGAEALFKQFTKDRRRNIRFAEKNGVEVSEVSTDQDISDAYAVQSAWRETQRKTVIGAKLSFESFRQVVALRGNRRIFIARVAGKAIATNGFRFYLGSLFESSSNSSLEEFMHLKPNDLLQWRGIEWACQNGLRRHSLGASHQFLMRFGGTVIPILHYRLDRTWLRRHDLSDKVKTASLRVVRELPPSVETNLRKLTAKQKTSRS
jgi:hypothetical protein